ncbi:MAG: prefoldin subunit [Candidatus Aenigmatarchaeota archaeon]|nr:prefoldin subunit [Candidatus Aenigmarchaeota archaeon]
MNEEERRQAEELVAKFQKESEQLERMLLQKQALMLKKVEIEQAINELEKSEVKEAYKIAGTIMIMKSKEELLKELKDALEETDLQVKVLERSEIKLRESLEESGKKLQKMFPELKEES